MIKMAKRGKSNNAKFKIGDIVVITLYGTVGKVTDIKMLDGQFVYEVNNSEGLFQEESLAFLSEYEGKVLVTEKLNIEYRYFIGDIVQIKGYGKELFKIIGFRTEIWRYKEDAWEDTIYELTRISDGEWMEVAEEEVTLVIPHDNKEILIQKFGLMHMLHKEKTSLELHNQMNGSNKYIKKDDFPQEHERIVDGLLDVYNDYKMLYELFGDNEYKEVMDLVIENLEKYINGKKQKYLRGK